MAIHLGLGVGLGTARRAGGRGARATSAEVMADGRLLVVTFEQTTPVNFGVPDWYLGRLAGASCRLSNGARLAFLSAACRSNVPAFAAATWDGTAKTITKAGAFANYVWKSGDQIGLISGTAGPELSLIASKNSDDQITLTSASTGSNGTTTVCTEMPAGQGTKLIWEVALLLADGPITYDATGLTFSADDGLLFDTYGNKTRAVSGLAVTNSSIVDASGSTTENGFAPGGWFATIHVCPGHAGASDSYTFAQANNNMNMPYATLNKAMSVVTAGNGCNNKPCRILIQQGTAHTMTAQGKLWVNGQDRLNPYLVDWYWDASAGVGTQGARPKITYTADAAITSGGGGASLATSDYIVIRRLEIEGNNTKSNLIFNRSSNLTLDECDIHHGEHNVDFLGDFSSPSTRALNTRVTALRCIMRDSWGSGAPHSQGVYATNSEKILISQCHFDRTGLRNSDGFGGDPFSRAMYLDSENGSMWVWGCLVSRSDGIQVRSSGHMVDCVYTQTPLVNFIANGRMARVYTELGSNFGTTTFTGATYTHSTRTLAATGIGTGMSATSTINVSAGTGVAVKRYRVASAPTADSIVLVGNGLGAGADGSSDVAGVLETTPRGFGPGSQYVSDVGVGGPQVIEQCLPVYLGTYGGDPRALDVAAPQTAQTRAPRQLIIRNNTSRQSGPMLFHKQSTSPMSPTMRGQNLVDNRGTTQKVVNDDAAITDWSFLQSDKNVYLSDAASPFTSVGGTTPLSGYRATTGQEANSRNADTPVYANDGADLGSWAGACGLTATTDALIAAVRGRAAGSWPAWADMRACVDYMFDQYEVVSGLPAVGTAPLDFYGCGTGDPTLFE